MCLVRARLPGPNFSSALRLHMSLLPDMPPPCDIFDRRRYRQRRLFPDLFDPPAGEIRERLSLLLATLGQRPLVVSGRRTGVAASPRVPQHVPPLEVLAVAGLLEHQILREVLRVVADVQAGDEGVLSGARVVSSPEHAERLQLGR